MIILLSLFLKKIKLYYINLYKNLSNNKIMHNSTKRNQLDHYRKYALFNFTTTLLQKFFFTSPLTNLRFGTASMISLRILFAISLASMRLIRILFCALTSLICSLRRLLFCSLWVVSNFFWRWLSRYFLYAVHSLSVRVVLNALPSFVFALPSA